MLPVLLTTTSAASPPAPSAATLTVTLSIAPRFAAVVGGAIEVSDILRVSASLRRAFQSRDR